MNIKFMPLSESHFLLLLKWLQTPHVKLWWDQNIKWTPELIQKKYSSYVKGYKLENGVAKPINPYVIYIDFEPIGYIQIYNAYDFARVPQLEGLPINLAAFDIFIGEESALKRGIDFQAIAQFLKEHAGSYAHIFADPDSANLAAIRTYEKAGFASIKQINGVTWMLKNLAF